MVLPLHTIDSLFKISCQTITLCYAWKELPWSGVDEAEYGPFLALDPLLHQNHDTPQWMSISWKSVPWPTRLLQLGLLRWDHPGWWHTPGAHACTKDRIGERQALKVRHWSDMTKSQGMPAPRSSKTSPSEHSIHCEWVKDWSNPPVEEIGRGQESLSYHIVHRQVCYSTYYLPGSPMTSGSQNLTKHSLGANIDWHLTAGYQLDSSLVTHHMVYCSICHRMVVLSLEYRRGNWGSS